MRLIFIDEIFKLFIYTRAGAGTTGLFFYSQDMIPTLSWQDD